MEDIMTKNIALLGSTGSIGQQTLEIVDAYPQKFKIKVLAAFNSAKKIEEQARRFMPELIVLGDHQAALGLRETLKDLPVQVLGGKEAFDDCVLLAGVDTVVVAVSGMKGMVPTLKAVEAGKNVLLANKEALVTGGELISRAAREKAKPILPIDSEHSALWQCMQGQEKYVDNIILTASGGPFRDWDITQMGNITPEMALSHPNWTMGPKVTVDSSTLMNKGLEVIEAHWLFDIKYSSIKVMIHPQSLVHSMVEFKDGSILAQLGNPDMRLPIQYAMSWPERWPSNLPRLNLTRATSLSFYPPDTQKFPCLELAYHAGNTGGMAPVILNAANEEAVNLFLSRKIRYLDIQKIVAEALEKISSHAAIDLETIIGTDAETRRWVQEYW
ncbi:MAG: 1-deoxy-D-xylulose-5-phosphate reductoisomerase [Syntrophomonadaceae bacterium]|nr:1-deoxy-D-xylulose-5-phosphate reductoisomerase [Syntrophomonadaceae bacterium]